MAAEEDNFDIDIYGDGGGSNEDHNPAGQTDDIAQGLAAGAESDVMGDPPQASDAQQPITADHAQTTQSTNTSSHPIVAPQSTSDEAASSETLLELPKKAPQPQGLKRKDGPDDRPIAPGATNALFISDLHWWITDEDIRGWANQSQCEDELQDITFSEHKVNGKSKGQAYVLFSSSQASTAAKQHVDGFGEEQQYKQKFNVTFTNPMVNPFKTLPKDGNNRGHAQPNRNNSGSYGGMASQSQSGGFSNGGYRGGRGNYNNNNRGGASGNGMPQYNRGYGQQPMATGYQAAPMGFQAGGMAGMQPYGAYANRGAMMSGMRANPMGMRGGRGGMMGMPMGGMPMAMPGQMPGQMPIGMPQPMGMTGFHNPAFYPTGQESWNPHGAKRTRQE